MSKEEEKNNIFITSNYQSGGITAHTVNMGLPPRSMNDFHANELKKILPNGSNVHVLAIAGDLEAANFAEGILNWLKLNGYNVHDSVGYGMFFGKIMPQNFKQIGDNDYELLIGANQSMKECGL